MDVRGKLVELLSEIIDGGFKWHNHLYESGEQLNNDDIASFLIDNGVTVQEWISVNDRLPPHNHDVLVYRPDMAMKILVDNYYGYYGEDDAEWHEGWAKYGKDIHNNPLITHWMPLPQPPKGE